jgi:molybdenum cofactor cytidylyltransferase
VTVAGIILSAGESRRMGSPKALLELEGETFLDRLTRLFGAVCDPVIVVLGHGPEAVRAGVRHPERARFVQNPDYALGMFSSLQCGLRAVPAEAAGVLMTPVDHPAVEAGTIAALLAEGNALIAVPVFKGHRGHPLYFRRELIAEFLALPPGSRARVVMERHASDIRYVETADPGIHSDIDDPAAYARLIGAATP